MEDGSHINATEFARRVGANRETIRRHLLTGKLAFVRPGREYLIAEREVRRWRRGKPGRPRKPR